MNIIVAVNSDWGIGSGGTQQIVISGDRRRFKDLTEGGVVIAGRKTFEEIGGPLPNRKNIVLTRNKDFTVDRAIIAHSVDEVLTETSGDDSDRVFVIGGGEIYKLFLPMCLYAYVTIIEASPLSDAFFPDLNKEPGWTLENESGTPVSEKGVKYSFRIYKNSEVKDYV